MSGPRRILDGTGPFSGIGMVAWLAGLVMLMSILMSPNGWGWWMDAHSVQGREVDGLVYYSVNGVKYTLNDPQSFPGSRTQQRTVYYLPSQPADASLHSTANEVIDWGLTVGPGAAGAVLLAIGFAKRARRDPRAEARRSRESFGHGIPPETIRAIIDRNKRSSA